MILASCQTKNRYDIEWSRPAMPVVQFDELEPYLEKQNDTTYVVNFWATWCPPCVKELPAFEKAVIEYGDKPVQVILVSLDMKDKIEDKVIPFIDENQLRSQLFLLDDPYSAEWIPKVDPHWDGAIPVTLIYNKDKRMFFNQTFEYDELSETIMSFL